MLGLLSSLVLTTPAAAEPNVIHFPISRVQPSAPTGLARRASGNDTVVSAKLDNAESYYALVCALGTPPQNIELVLDTGSSDFWVLSPEVEECQAGKCAALSEFEPDKSSSAKTNNTEFYNQYGDSSSVNGTMYTDVLHLSGSTLDGFNFAVAHEASSSQPVAGIGLMNGESGYELNNEMYPNLPVQLKQSGLISYLAYSLWLDSYETSSGNILFGGIDTSAFSGDLYRFPLVPADTAEINRLAIRVDSLWLFNGKGQSQKVADVQDAITFDSGSTISAMPSEVLEVWMPGIGANYYDEAQMWLMECSELEKHGGALGLEFSGVEYVFDFATLGMMMAETESGTKLCSPGWQSSELWILGDNALRSLYVVYDLQNKELGIASAVQATASTPSPKYVEMSTGIPGTKAPNYHTVNPSSSSIFQDQGYSPTVFGHFTQSSSGEEGTRGPAEPVITPLAGSPNVTVGNPSGAHELETTYTGFSAELASISTFGAAAPGSDSASETSANGDNSGSGSSSTSSSTTSKSRHQKNAAAAAAAAPVLALVGLPLAFAMLL